jgi:hypothetical protein
MKETRKYFESWENVIGYVGNGREYLNDGPCPFGAKKGWALLKIVLLYMYIGDDVVKPLR